MARGACLPTWALAGNAASPHDTSYYRGARYTVLVGLLQRSQACQLVCQLYKDDPTRTRQDLVLATDPGTMVIFNADTLWHAVMPLEPGAERIVLSMAYVTNPTMGTFQRSLSNLKDAIAYFGVAALVRRRRGPRHTWTTADHRGSACGER